MGQYGVIPQLAGFALIPFPLVVEPVALGPGLFVRGVELVDAYGLDPLDGPLALREGLEFVGCTFSVTTKSSCPPGAA